MEVRCFTGGNFAQNGYVAWCEATRQCVIVDPGAEALDMVTAVEEGAGELTAILLTHAHFDHIEGLGVIRDYSDAPTYLHPADREMFDNLPAQAAMFGLSSPQLAPPEREFEDGETFRFGESGFKVIHTPGHSLGHVILHALDDGLALRGGPGFRGLGRTDRSSRRGLSGPVQKHSRTCPHDARRDAALHRTRAADHRRPRAYDQPLPDPELRRRAGVTPPVHAAVFASGSGTNLQALLDHETANGPYHIVVVISDREDRGALQRAEAAGRLARIIEVRGRPADEVASETLALLKSLDVQAIFLSGYLRMIPAAVVSTYRRRILNIHPALLPAFRGARVCSANMCTRPCSHRAPRCRAPRSTTLTRNTIPGPSWVSGPSRCFLGTTLLPWRHGSCGSNIDCIRPSRTTSARRGLRAELRAPSTLSPPELEQNAP